MKAALVIGIALLTASPFALLALDTLGIGPAFEATPPEWEAGHSWTWDVTGRGRAVGEGFGVVRFESENLHVDATRQAEVLNTTLTEDGVAYDLVLEAFHVDRVRYGDKVVFDADEEGDGAPMDGDGFSEAFFCLTPCETLLAPYTKDGNPFLGAEAFDEIGSDQVRLLDFPLTRGKEWSVLEVKDDEMRLEIRAEAVDNEYIDLPNFAPMQTVRIEAGLTDASKAAIKQLAKQEAEREGFDIDLDFDLTLTYWYSPEIQNIVKLDLDGFLAGRGTGYGSAAAGRVDFHLDQVLSEAVLEPTRERSLEEAYALAEATWAADGDTEAASSEVWPFTVGATELSVDADAGEEVRFGLLEGAAPIMAEDHPTTTFDAPPETARTEWTHRWTTADGPQTETATGPEATFTFDSPGGHVVTAQLLDAQGRVMSADRIVVEAYTHRTVTLDGPAAGLLGTAHSLDQLYVAPGASFATATAASDLYAKGVLKLEGPGGEAERSMSLDRDSDAVTLDHPTAGDHWVTWTDEARAGAMTITVEVRYEDPAGWRLKDAGAAGPSPPSPFEGLFEPAFRLF